MTTLRRVLLQSAREAGPLSDAKPATPHPLSGKQTPRKGSPSLSADEEEADETRKFPLSKKRRSSKGWDDAGKDTGKEGERESFLKSPKAASKELSSDPASKSPRSIKSSNSASSTQPPKSPRPSAEKVERIEKTEKFEKLDKSSQLAPFPAPANSNSLPPALQIPNSVPVRNKTPPSVDQVTRTPSPPAREPKDAKENVPRGDTRQSNAPGVGGKQQQASSSTSAAAKPKMSTINAVIAQEWVQCESCKKWRKLPLSISASSLPDTWVCEMNTWNAAMASCSASVEEGSEETTTEDANGAADGNLIAGTNGTSTTNTTRKTALPPGINLYGGQVQPQPSTVGPNGQKQPRVVSYRELISAHYRHNKNFTSGYNTACDSKYAPFSAYVSPSLKQRPFNDSHETLGRLLGWKPSSSSSASSSSSSSPSANENIANGSSISSEKRKDLPVECLPPKKRYRFIGQSASS